MKKWISRVLYSLSITLLLTACPDPEDYFADYRGTDLLADQDFDSGEWTRTYCETPGTSFEYLEWEDTLGETIDTTGLTTGSSVYRLNLKNLFAGGNFEAVASGDDPADDGWLLTSTSGATSYIDYLDLSGGSYPSSLGTLSFNYNLQNLQDWIKIDLKNQHPTAFVVDMTYSIEFDIYHEDEAFIQIVEDGIGDFPETIPKPNTIGITHYPVQTTNAIKQLETLNTDLVIGSIDESAYPQVTTYLLDNLEIVRTDITPVLELEVPYSRENRLDLVSGWYAFSVWVAPDPTAGSDSTLNRRLADGLSIEIYTFQESTEELKLTGSEPFTEASAFSGWTQITSYFQAQIDLPPESELQETRIWLRVSPCNLNATAMRTGSLLISNPELEYLPEGPES